MPEPGFEHADPSTCTQLTIVLPPMDGKSPSAPWSRLGGNGRELLGMARRRLGPAVAPRQITFDQDLPHTRSGKVMRRLLKAREVGEDEGDTSTVEDL